MDLTSFSPAMDLLSTWTVPSALRQSTVSIPAATCVQLLLIVLTTAWLFMLYQTVPSDSSAAQVRAVALTWVNVVPGLACCIQSDVPHPVLQRVPSSSMARVKSLPHATSVNVLSDAVSVHVVRLSVSPVPSWPLPFQPAVHRCPSVSMAAECLPPAATLLHVPSTMVGLLVLDGVYP